MLVDAKGAGIGFAYRMNRICDGFIERLYDFGAPPAKRRGQAAIRLTQVLPLRNPRCPELRRVLVSCSTKKASSLALSASASPATASSFWKRSIFSLAT